MRKRAVLFACILGSALLSVFLYVLAHETGHLIVMLSAGASITDFSVFGAHVSSVGGIYTDPSLLWMHANGAVFPLVLSWAWTAFCAGRARGTFLKVLSWFFGLLPAASLLAWTAVPVLWTFGAAPLGDDVTNFLDVFCKYGPPWAVCLAAAVLIGISAALLVVKRVPQDFVEEVRQAR